MSSTLAERMTMVGAEEGETDLTIQAGQGNIPFTDYTKNFPLSLFWLGNPSSFSIDKFYNAHTPHFPGKAGFRGGVFCLGMEDRI
jgi:hypothetical protein